MATFGDKLKKIRQEAGLTQQQLAEKTETQSPVIVRYEGNKVKNPRPKTLEIFAKALNVKPEELKDDMPGKEIYDLLKHYESVLCDQQIMLGLRCLASLSNAKNNNLSSGELLTNLTKAAKTNMSVAVATDNTLSVLEKHGITINNEIVIKVLEVSSYQVWKALEQEGK